MINWLDKHTRSLTWPRVVTRDLISETAATVVTDVAEAHLIHAHTLKKEEEEEEPPAVARNESLLLKLSWT